MEDETPLKRLIRDNEFIYKKLRVEERKVRIASDALEQIIKAQNLNFIASTATEALRKMDRAKYEN